MSTLVDAGVVDRRDTYACSRSNLLLLTRLVIRGLLERCMQSKCRMMSPSEHPQLQDFFIMVEKVLKHGFRGSRFLMKSPDQDLWLLFERCSKMSKDIEEAVTCIQQLPSIPNGISRVRAFLRLALMQKKLSDYFQLMVDFKDLLKEFYEEWALLRHETTGVIFVGSLVGLRVIDCNLYLKAEELAKQPTDVDLNAYIKIPTLALDEDDNEKVERSYESMADMKAVLDQKNYLEERNRYLSTTVDNLRARIKIYETMRGHRGGGGPAVIPVETENNEKNVAAETVSNTGDNGSNEFSMLNKTDELETAMGLLEKDVHEKQDTIISLRQQIEDIKKINIDLYQKVRVFEESGKNKDKLITRLEKEIEGMKIDSKKQIDVLEARIKDLETRSKQDNNMLESLQFELKAKTEFCATIQSELTNLMDQNRVLEEAAATDKLIKEQLQNELNNLRNTEQSYVDLVNRCAELEKTAADYEGALEEMGSHLSQSKLAVEDLKEGMPLSGAQWESNKDVAACKICQLKFSVSRRKHHCRNCGGIFCASCSDNTMPLPSSSKPVRVCDSCYSVLLQRFSSKNAPPSSASVVP